MNTRNYSRFNPNKKYSRFRHYKGRRRLNTRNMQKYSRFRHYKGKRFGRRRLNTSNTSNDERRRRTKNCPFPKGLCKEAAAL